MGEPVYYWRIITGLVLALLFSLTAFFFQRLSLDGMFAAILIGAFIFGLGGWQAAAVVLLFFVSSAFISGIRDQNSRQVFTEVRRSGLQVWANGFALVVCLVLSTVFIPSVYLIGGMSAIAVATADTWATELRSTEPNTTHLITTFELVEPGTDGGVSLRGTVWSAIGSLLISAASIYVLSLQLWAFFIIFIAGFLGCLLDSYLGAMFQRINRPVQIPFIQTQISIGNNLVNATATGAGALLAITLSALIL